MIKKSLNMDIGGKVPPQAVEFEEAILGALMLEKTSIDRTGGLTSEMFYSEPNRLLFQAITELKLSNLPVDILTISHKLKEKGELDLVGGSFYIAKLTSRVSSAAHIEHHCAIIYQEFVKREMIRICSQKLQSLFTDGCDAFDEKQSLINELEVLTIGTKKEFKEFLIVAADNIKKM